MIYERVKVEIGNAVQATLFLYLHESYPETYGDRKRPLVLICPGGGYEHVSVREGEPIAFQFLTAGCHAAVLWYDISRQGAEHPQALMELAWSVAYIREHAEEYAVDRAKLLWQVFQQVGIWLQVLAAFGTETGLKRRWAKKGNGINQME